MVIKKMTTMKKISIFLVAALALSSCVTKKKFQASQSAKDKLEMSLRQTTSDLAECEKIWSEIQRL